MKKRSTGREKFKDFFLSRFLFQKDLQVLRVSLFPCGDAFCEEVQMFAVRGSEGELAVMAGHIPIITSVKSGKCHIQLPDGSVQYANTAGGLLSVLPDKVTFITEKFEFE